MNTHNFENEDWGEWDDGTYGQSLEHAAVSAIDPSIIEQGLNLQSISIRMPIELLEQLKTIAKIRGLGYQPLIKQTLQRFVIAETKAIAREYAGLLESKKVLQEIDDEHRQAS